MIAALIDVKVDPSKVEELKKEFTALRKTVLENEPGVLVYHLVKPRDGSDEYRFVEIYQDMDAVKVHSAADYMRETTPKLTACLTEAPGVKMYDVVV